jgi:hypothetical protein
MCELPISPYRFYHELPQICAAAFSAYHRSASSAVLRKWHLGCRSGRITLIFTLLHIRNVDMYDGLKFVLGILIRIRFDPDFFFKIWILERAIAVRGAIFSVSDKTKIPSRSKIRDSKNLGYGYANLRTVASKRWIFKRKKG